jgi:hypothetical protein
MMAPAKPAAARRHRLASLRRRRRIDAPLAALESILRRALGAVHADIGGNDRSRATVTSAAPGR